MFSAVKRSLGGGNKGEKNEEKSTESHNKQSDSSSKPIESGFTNVKEATGFTKEEDKQFDKARAKTMEAEQAARLAHANAEKALRLLKVSEESSREVDEYHKQVQRRAEQLEDLKGADTEARLAQAALDRARQDAGQKAAARNDANKRATSLKEQLDDAGAKLKQQQAEVVRLAGEEDKARQSANSHHVSLQGLDRSEPEKQDKAKQARLLADDKAKLLDKLKGDVKADEDKAADLERQAAKLRQSAKVKSEEADKLGREANELKKKADASEQDHQSLKRDQKTFTTQLTEAKGNADDLAKAKAAAEDKLMKLSSALEDISKQANDKLKEADAKRAAHEGAKAEVDSASKVANNAVAGLKETNQTRATLQQEKEEYTSKMEKLEDKLAVETDAAQKALNEAKRAAEVKHGKWLEAEKAGKEADAYAAQKQAKVEEVLNDKITGLAQKAKEVNRSETKTEVTSNKERTAESSQTNKDGKQNYSKEGHKEGSREQTSTKDGAPQSHTKQAYRTNESKKASKATAA